MNDEDWYDGFRAAIRCVREQTGGGYDAEVEREATAQRMEDALVAHGGRVTAACEPPKNSPEGPGGRFYREATR